MPLVNKQSEPKKRAEEGKNGCPVGWEFVGHDSYGIFAGSDPRTVITCSKTTHANGSESRGSMTPIVESREESARFIGCTMRRDDIQLPYEKCVFCGSGITCAHGRCETCQVCRKCDRIERGAVAGK